MTGDINDIIGTAEEKNCINFTITNVKFLFSLHHNDDESYFFLKKPENYKFKAHNKIPWNEFCLGSVSKDFKKIKGVKFD